MEIKNTEFITSAATEKQFIKSEKPIIAVAGKSNVGKSSFINMLAGRKNLARTSSEPGRTRLVNYFDFGEFVLADLPGYGFAKVSKEEKEKWARNMEAFFADKTNADYVLLLLDIRHDPTADDVQMVKFLHANAYSYCFIATKADKISRLQVNKRVKEIASYLKVTELNILPVSSTEKRGREEVISKIEAVLNALKEE